MAESASHGKHKQLFRSNEKQVTAQVDHFPAPEALMVFLFQSGSDLGGSSTSGQVCHSIKTSGAQ
jgi:hypothetical protein